MGRPSWFLGSMDAERSEIRSLGIFGRISRRCRGWRKLAQAYHSDFQRNKLLPGFYVMLAARTLAICGLLLVASLGGVVGSWISHRTFPLAIFERAIVNKMVKAGEPVLIRVTLERREQCFLTTRRTVTYSDGRKIPMSTEMDIGFGPLGKETYLLVIQTSEFAPPGPATIRSQGFSECNPIEKLFPVPSDVYVDNFEIIKGDE